MSAAKEPRRRLPLKHAIVWALVGIGLVAALGGTWVTRQILASRLEHETRRRAETLAQLVALAADVSPSHAQLDHLIETWRLPDDVVRVVLFDLDTLQVLSANDLCCEASGARLLADLPDRSLATLSRDSAPVWSQHSAQRRCLLIYPAELHVLWQSEPISAAVLVELDSTRIEHEIAAAATQIVVVLLAALALLTATAYGLLDHLVLKPVQAICSAMQRRAAGDRTAYAPLSGTREIARVADTFNHLVDSVARTEANLQNYAVALESSNRALEEFSRAAQAANLAKSEFLANMSHEIRTPMTAILGYADMLCDQVSELESLEAIRTIRRNGEHLLDIINDILDLSKIEADRLEVEQIECSPFDLLSDVRSLMQVRADDGHLELTVRNEGPLPETIVTDPRRLRQVLINLVGNAIKFTLEGRVEVVARLIARDGESLLAFDVVDSGIGMDRDQMERLFQPFTQADSSMSRRFGGTGLGLTISKRLVEMLGGEIHVESQPGRGSRFTFTVRTGPLEGVAMLSDEVAPTEIRHEALAGQSSSAGGQTATRGGAPAATDLTGVRVLLAEDGPDNQRLISFLLTKAGAEVVVVDNGKKAVEEILAKRQPLDVVLMDMQMPVLDGYGATQQLRRLGYRGPVVALTAHAMSGDRAKCQAAGCDEYLTKPIDRRQLLATVAQFADTSRVAAVT